MTEAHQPPRPATGPTPTRIGNVERQQAMDALDVHMSAGRLDPDEYGERIGKASVARTTADLEPLFDDLPAPRATGAVSPMHEAPTRSAMSAPAPAWLPPPPAPDGGGRQRLNSREPLGGRAGEVACAVSPFVALILFFIGGAIHFGEAWLFFLLIPIVGVVVYGHGHHDRPDRRARR